jgi:gamma-glutamyl-gamma-aminobutyrate hydrolase PuuD
VLAVQWHPETGDDPSLFRALIAAASGRSAARSPLLPAPTSP